MWKLSCSWFYHDSVEGVSLASLQILHDPLDVCVQGGNGMKRRGDGEGVEIHEVGEVGVGECGVGVNQSRAVVHSEDTRGIEDEDVGRGGTERAVEVEGDEVGSLLDSRVARMMWKLEKVSASWRAMESVLESKVSIRLKRPTLFPLK